MVLSFLLMVIRNVVGFVHSSTQYFYTSWWQLHQLESFSPTSDFNTNNAESESHDYEDSQMILEAIREDLREILPPSCVLESESLKPAQKTLLCGDSTDLVEHVDSFIYDEDDLDIACSQGTLSRHYCTTCGSKAVKEIELISHSFSANEVKYICKCLLSNCKGKILVDIGSRTGAVLYGVALFSPLKRCIGVEMNGDFCKISQSMVDKYDLSEKISIVHDDIINCPQLLAEADVVVMNNVFDFYSDKDSQRKLWRFCLDEIKKKSGRLLITYPEVSTALAGLDMLYDTSFLRKLDLSDQVERYEKSLKTQNDDDLDAINMYIVK